METPNNVQRLFRKEVGRIDRNRGDLNKNSMKYLVYLTVCTPNNKIYIGVHQVEDPNMFCGYIGCGVNIKSPSSYKKSKTPFQYAVNKYGPKNFKRITLAVFDTKQEAYALEKRLVTNDFLKRQDTYNFKIGGEGGCPPNLFVKIYMYDLDGNFVQEFETAYACNKFLDPRAKNGSPVLKAIRTGQILHNYQFSKEKVPFMKKYTPKQGSHKFKIKVGRYDDSGNLLETFESILECVKAGYKNVGKALKTNRKCKGFYFKKLN